ncbi:MAG TPA: formate dehydrogenase accessory sulfurtransferase FdhD [Saprospiraceae bacterium]|nr:formate dehydrogenase accessory sulfurtransferase FdhD [Saprospiraceae bacterium]HPI07327.1 formate dehydrogenase accessory sulfurtransferase FdhD [Saprospiraceae bacterium]
MEIAKHPSIDSATVTVFDGNTVVEKQDFLAVEEPLEIRVEYGPEANRITQPLSITMRTPGADEDLVRGFLLTESIVKNASEIQAVLPVSQNVVLAQLVPTARFDMARLDRHFYTSSSCGVCGKTSIDAVQSASPGKPILLKNSTLSSEILCALPDRLRQSQETFEMTGGLHAAALFSWSGDLMALREDVGRHNALDKLIGQHAHSGHDFGDTILLLSGRASFELLQKSAVAGIPVVCAVGAPSSLAVETARSFGITLIGFLRGKRFNLYSKPENMEIGV